jgi:DNA ligase 4
VIESSLTVDDLNDILDELSKNMGKQYVFLSAVSISSMNSSCRDAQSKILQRVYNRATPEEQRWIVRIILKGCPYPSLIILLSQVLVGQTW